MIIGCCRIEVHLPESGSLKTKRHLLKSLTSRIKNHFNVSVAEVDGNDLWQRAVIGVAVVTNEARFADQVISKVIDHVRNDGRLVLIDYQTEIR
jgi:uncharacterized protein YlxP (DUF503 family)